MFVEVRIIKFATIRLEAEDEGDAILKVAELDLRGKWSSCWGSSEIKRGTLSNSLLPVRGREE